MYLNQKLLHALRAGGIEKFFAGNGVNYSLAAQPLGELFLPTGAIVANDPLCMFETAPFQKTVEPGRYQVILYILNINTDKRVAFSELRFKDSMPVRFELAIKEGQDISQLGEDEFFGYGVDSGTGSFMDAAACLQMMELFKQDETGALPFLENPLNESYIYTYSAANVLIPGQNVNVAAFSTGYGDGAYPSYWGIDDKNRICCLITDFCLLGFEEE